MINIYNYLDKDISDYSLVRDSFFFPRTNSDDIEIGAFTSWFGDPSKETMVHYHLEKDEEVTCLLREEGSYDWEVIAIEKNLDFPKTKGKVKWFKMENLKENTIYETKLQGSTTIHKFETMPKDYIRDVEVALISDMANSPSEFRRELPIGLNTIHSKETDLIVIAGDGVHDDGYRYPQWLDFFNEYYKAEKEFGRMIPMIMCLGNHDGRVEDEDGNFKALIWYLSGARREHITFAYNFFSNLNDNAYGSIQISDYINIIYLNSFHTIEIQGEQTDWLETELKNSQDYKHIFPFFHVPPYPAFYEYSGIYSSQVRNTWTPLFTEHGVKIAGSGHEHAHVVTKKATLDQLDKDGVVYTGQGHGMGNTTRGLNIDKEDWFVDYIDISEKGFDFINFATNGNVILEKVNLHGELKHKVEL